METDPGVNSWVFSCFRGGGVSLVCFVKAAPQPVEALELLNDEKIQCFYFDGYTLVKVDGDRHSERWFALFSGP